MVYIPRNLEQKIRDSLNNYPVVAILGPGQCGKSTLADRIISKSFLPERFYQGMQS